MFTDFRERSLARVNKSNLQVEPARKAKTPTIVAVIIIAAFFGAGSGIGLNYLKSLSYAHVVHIPEQTAGNVTNNPG